jgi:glycosyltransferase involved in cell wall biosynthesis
VTELGVSCVVPVFNCERYLAEAVESILSQTHVPVEVIVVDDGSTDRTPAIASSFPSPVRSVRQEHSGVSAARNRGIRESTGDLVAFLDADDLFLPEKLALQVAQFAVRPELEMSAAHTENFQSLDAGEESGHDPKMTEPWPRHISTWILRRQVFDRVGFFDESMPLSQDVDWHMRAMSHGIVSETLPDILTMRRLHHGNATRRARADCRSAVLGSLRAHIERQRKA